MQFDLDVDSHTGTPTISIPIPLPESRGGFTPELELSFRPSQNGPFGLGWALSLPAITRMGDDQRPTYVDDLSTREPLTGDPGPDDGGEGSARERPDRFSLSGVGELVPAYEVGDAADDRWERVTLEREGFTIYRYRPRVEQGFTRIERWVHPDGSSHWRTTTGEGVTAVYGSSSETRVQDPADPTRIFRWLLERMVDDRGNALVYEYKPEDGAQVDRSCASEAHRFTQGRSGEYLAQRRYLKRIKYGNTKPYRANAGGLPADNEWMFRVVLDYGGHDRDRVEETSEWDVRPDPFSDYQAGFELRSYRLCRRLLVFHRFAELGADPVLARSIHLKYGPVVGTGGDADTNRDALDQSVARAGVVLRRISYRGHRNDGPEGGWTERVPPLDFSYSRGEIGDVVHEAKGAQVPAGLDGMRYRTFDLFGEGVPGILAERDGAWYYQENRGGGSFGPLRPIQDTPASEPGSYYLSDVDGDGKPDVIQMNGGAPGSYEMDPQARRWTRFRTFESAARVGYGDGGAQPTDLTGDGLSDLAAGEDGGLTWYASKGKKGYEDPARSTLAHDDRNGPGQVKTDPQKGYFLANLSGSGQDVIRVRNGEVCYWPSLGFGRYGRKVVMESAPRFDHPDAYDPRRLHFVDVTGSSTADLIYIGSNGTTCWYNESGNGFSEGQPIDVLPAASSVEMVAVGDFLGEGTPCLAWSSPLPGAAHAPLRYVRLVGSTPALMLTSIRNNMGRETRLGYTSSAAHYLADKEEGRPWHTRLHAHVPVVDHVEHVDHVTGSRLHSRYVYHDGYFDSEEREFKGFSYVEQYDSEFFSEDNYPELESGEYVVPTCTKTWFHNGAPDARRTASGRDFYKGDDKAHSLPEPVVERASELDERTVADAFRALSGRVMRREVFEVKPSQHDDRRPGTPGDHPYTVTETALRIRPLQPAAGRHHGSFLAYESESLTHHYEQEPSDPRAVHEFTLEVDELGYPTRTCVIAYPRRDSQDVEPEQRVLHATVRMNEFAHVSADFFRHGISLETRSFEAAGLTLESDGYLSREALRVQLSTALQSPVSYDTNLDEPGAPATRLFSWEQHFYYGQGDAFTQDPSALSAPLRLHHTETAAFNDAVLTEALGERVDAADVGALEYVHREGYWWMPSDTRSYLGPDAFFLPNRTTDPFGNTEIVTYDDVHFAVTERTDPAGNVTKTETDYLALQPRSIIDPNETVHEVRYDPLNRVIATSMRGEMVSTGGSVEVVGDDPLQQFSAIASDSNDPIGDALADPHRLLQGTTTCYRYDAFAWMRSATPAAVLAISRETHKSELDSEATSRVQVVVSYADGFGRTVQIKKNADKGPAFIRTEDGRVEEQDDVEDRWLATGGVVHNNKGAVVKQFEPIFTGSPDYEPHPAFLRHGATTVRHYDGLGRRVKTDTPKGFFTEVTFAPWQIRTSDENDTLERSFYFDSQVATGLVSGAEKDAISKAQQHVDTPSIHLLDSLGRPFLQRRILDSSSALESKTTLDIQGNAVKSVDPRQRKLNRQRSSREEVATFESIYDMVGRKLLTRNVDSSERRQLRDALDRDVHRWSARGFHTEIAYDVLSRPLEMRVRSEDGMDRIVERYTYGEDLSDRETAKRKNVLGRIVERRDQSGLTVTERCDISGRPLETSKRIRKDYKSTADWSGNVELRSETFTTFQSYDALGRVTRRVLADGTVQTPTYHRGGLVDKIEVTAEDGTIDEVVVAGIDYNARGQRVRVRYGNGVHSSYTYDDATFRLRRLFSQHGSGSSARTVQEVDYTYDPVGNLTHKDDRTREHVLGHLPADHTDETRFGDYTYDALYRLRQATGWLHEGLQQHDYSGDDRPPEAFKGTRHLHLNNSVALKRYTRHYDYDEAGNMTRMRQTGDVAWTRDMWVSETSNRSLPKHLPGGMERSDPETAFDAAGNLTSLDHLDGPLRWNYRDRLMSAVVVDRSADGGEDDAVYYVYDASGIRVCKVEERLEHGQLVVKEKLYLGGCEIKRVRRGDRTTLERTTCHVEDGDRRIASIHRWSVDERNTETDTPEKPAVHYILEDRVGSSSLELDEQGKVISYEEFAPYGRTMLLAGDKVKEVRRKDYRYAGKERDDATGLYYYGQRYLATWMARWLNPDPLGPVDGMNLYQFSHNNPIGLRDLKGNQSELTEDEAMRRIKQEASPAGSLPKAVKEDPEAMEEIRNLPYGKRYFFYLDESGEFTSHESASAMYEAAQEGDHQIRSYNPHREQAQRLKQTIIELEEQGAFVDPFTGEPLGKGLPEVEGESSEGTESGKQIAEDRSSDDGEETESDGKGGAGKGSSKTQGQTSGASDGGESRRGGDGPRRRRDSDSGGTSRKKGAQGEGDQPGGPSSPRSQPNSDQQPFGDPEGMVCNEIKKSAVGKWNESLSQANEELGREAGNHGIGFAVATGAWRGIGNIGTSVIGGLDIGSDVLALPMAGIGEYAGVVEEGKTKDIACRLASTVHSVKNTIGTIINNPIDTLSNLHEAAVDTVADAMMGDMSAVSDISSFLAEALADPGKVKKAGELAKSAAKKSKRTLKNLKQKATGKTERGEHVDIEPDKTIQLDEERMEKLAELSDEEGIRWLAGEEDLYDKTKAARDARQATDAITSENVAKVWKNFRNRLGSRISIDGKEVHHYLKKSEVPAEVMEAENLFIMSNRDAHTLFHRAQDVEMWKRTAPGMDEQVIRDLFISASQPLSLSELRRRLDASSEDVVLDFPEEEVVLDFGQGAVQDEVVFEFAREGVPVRR